MDSSRPNLRIGWIAALLMLAVAYRVMTAGSTALANTSPLMAMCFGGGLLLGFRFCWVPVVMLIASDLALGFTQGTGVGSHTLFSAVAFTAAAAAGAACGRGHQRWTTMLFGTLACSVLFYLAANTLAWATAPGYAKTLAGWWQSQTVGLPGPWPPSIAFLRNALIGDVLWCVIAAPLFFWKPVSIRDEEPAGTVAA